MRLEFVDCVDVLIPPLTIFFSPQFEQYRLQVNDLVQPENISDRLSVTLLNAHHRLNESLGLFNSSLTLMSFRGYTIRHFGSILSNLLFAPRRQPLRPYLARNMNQLLTSFSLNETEQKILSALTLFCALYNKDKARDDRLELRITGGWVRDKLLGKESHDLDIAINVLSGEEFASSFIKYAIDAGYDLGLNTTDIHKIKKNPEKSKHLETCTTKIYGIDIDFVNLRSEQYTEDSRVPIIECGTAEEDALRRDATINALFYHVNNEKIEDFTGRGLQDLLMGILRTPLRPWQTFLDDPLRVLRLIRFAAQLNFTINPETLQAMTNSELKTALVHKISRERVGVELEKILMSKNVSYGLRLINYVGLTSVLFDCGPLREKIITLNESKIVDELKFLENMVVLRIDDATQLFDLFCEYVIKNDNYGQLAKQILSNSSYRKQLWLFVALEPYKGTSVQFNEKKKTEMSYVELIIKEGLRFGKSDYELVSTLTECTNSGFLHLHFSHPNETTRAQLGTYIRGLGQNFELSVVGNAFLEVINSIQVEDQVKAIPTPKGNKVVVAEKIIKDVVNNYRDILALIDQRKLHNVRKLRSLVDGRQISLALHRKPGPWMKAATQEVIKWQLDHPEGTADQCLEHVRNYVKYTNTVLQPLTSN